MMVLPMKKMVKVMREHVDDNFQDYIVSLWENDDKRISFVIGQDCELEIHDDGYGDKVYSIKRKIRFENKI